MSLRGLLRRLPASLALVGCLSHCTRRDGDVTGRVVSARSTLESIPAGVIAIAFRNDSPYPVEVRSYSVRWPGGSFSAEPRDLRIGSHAEVARTARIETLDGDVAALLARPHEATVETVWVQGKR